MEYVCHIQGFEEGLHSYYSGTVALYDEPRYMDNLRCDSASSAPPGEACDYTWEDTAGAQEVSGVYVQCSWGDMSLVHMPGSATPVETPFGFAHITKASSDGGICFRPGTASDA